MRRLITAAAVMTGMLALRPALAATYTYDTAYTFTGQSSSNSGRGIAVDSADTRLYETVRSSTQGGVVILATADGSVKGSITPASPTTINDIALSPDGALLYFVRDNGTDWEVDSAPAADGVHTSSEVATAISGISSTPGGIAVGASGTTVYLAVVTSDSFLLYSSVSGGAFSKLSEVGLGYIGEGRDVAALDTGAGLRFYVLTPVAQAPQFAMDVFNTSGQSVTTTWSALPAAYSGFNLDSITAAGAVDGTPSLFITAYGADTLGNPVLTSFRFAYNGTYANDGFGYGLSSTSPLQDLQPMDTPITLAPGAVSGNHFYLGVALPDASLNPVDQTIRVVLTPTVLQPATINGTVTDPAALPAVGAKVVAYGLNTPLTTTGSDGKYTLTPVNPGTLTLGASSYGYAATSTTVTVGSGETKTAPTMQLPTTVPTFTLGYAYLPVVVDGVVLANEYQNPAMTFYSLGGGTPDPTVQTTAYAMADATSLYVAVVGLEPSLGLNRAAYGDKNMLTLDDNVQILLDPPHRHDVKGATTNLFRFSVNLPPVIGGQPASQPMRFQSRINADGTLAESIPASAWWARVGYFANGWMVEARISLDAMPFPAPDATSVWGMLVARHRPSSHSDYLPVDYSTSNAPSARLSDSKVWMDVKFAEAVSSIKGDVNHNGVVDAADLAYVLHMVGGLSYGTPDPGDPGPDANLIIRNAVLAVADIWPAASPDGRITLTDAARLARVMMGLDTIN